MSPLTSAFRGELEAPSLKTFKAMLDGAWRYLVYWKVSLAMVF